jgi:hypothetical protein
MYEDPEISAMSKVLGAFKGLQNDQRRRIIDWITGKFGLLEDQQQVVKSPTRVSEKPADIRTHVEPEPVPEPVGISEEPTVGEAAQAEEPIPVEEEPAPGPDEIIETDKVTDPLKGLGLKRYRSIETLFLSSNVKTVPSKILLAAAYLQEKLNFEEISSFDINSRLKKMGYGVPNISSSLNSLLNKEPPLMLQIRKAGDSKQAKRKFRVTEEGLQLARTYLRGRGKGES